MSAAPIVVDFPLRGVWAAEHTPGHRVPSHGTNSLGQRYAYDLIRTEVDRVGLKFFPGSTLRYLVFGVDLADCHGWGAPIHSPFDGTVVTAEDGWRERQHIHLVRDLSVVVKNMVMFRPDGDLRRVLGNYIILEMADRPVYALIAHTRTGSVAVQSRQRVQRAQVLAEVGHSGNSTAPHLHFQLMDGPDITTANGVPCAFRSYEIELDGKWETVADGVPPRRRLLRYAEA